MRNLGVGWELRGSSRLFFLVMTKQTLITTHNPPQQQQAAKQVDSKTEIKRTWEVKTDGRPFISADVKGLSIQQREQLGVKNP